MKKDHDYSVFLAIIAIWMVIGGLVQCESERHLDDIRQELIGIRYKLNMTTMSHVPTAITSKPIKQFKQ